MFEVIAAGGGLQSTAMIEMALDSKYTKLQKPDLIIHADTGSETTTTMNTIERLQKLSLANKVPFVIVQSELGPLYTHLFQKNRINRIGDASCTDKWKLRPVNQYVKSVIDQTLPKPWYRTWIGITTDEIHRVRESPQKYLEHRYPLIELNKTRDDVRHWMNKNRPDVIVEKSGCFHCHFQPAKSWSNLKKNYPKYFEMALQLERNWKANGGKTGLFKGQSIEGFDYSHTLEDFGFDIQPADVSCSAAGACFY